MPAPKIVSLAEMMDLFVRQTGTGESVYRCPYCLLTGDGSPDRRGHLYINVVKGVGECKRCSTTVRVEMNAKDMEQELLALTQTQPREGGDDDNVGIQRDALLKDIRALGYTLVDYNVPANGHPYLDKRHINLKVARMCLVHWRKESASYLFPSINPYEPSNYSGWAIRSPEGWRETKSARKNLYIPYPSVRDNKYLVLVEGRADALSLFARGFPAVALGGDDATTRQIQQVGYIAPDYIDIFMDADATQRGLAIMNQLRTEFTIRGHTSTKINLVYYPVVKDPAEMDSEDLYTLLGSAVTPPDMDYEAPAGV